MPQSLRSTFLQFRRAPGVYGIVVLVLGLGIAVSVGFLTILDTLVLRPFGIERDDRVVALGGTAAPPGGDAVKYWSQATSLEAIATYRAGTVSMSVRPGETRPTNAAVVSDRFFSVIAAQVRIGRFFPPNSDNRATYAVLSDELWQKEFGGRTEVLGQDIRISGIPYRIIGVVRGDRLFPPAARLWITNPLAASPSSMVTSWDQARMSDEARSGWIGRLRPGVTPRQAQAELFGLLQRLTEMYTARTGIHFGDTVTVVPLAEKLTHRYRTAYVALFYSGIFFLLLAISNAAGLLLARSVRRQQEIAVRLSLGATMPRVFRQILSESLTLTSLAATVGLGACAWMLAGLRHLSRWQVPAMSEVALSPAAVFACVAMTLAIGFTVSLVPTTQAMRLDIAALLNHSGSGSLGGRPRRLYATLVVAQVALAYSLLLCDVLAVRNFSDLLKVDIGFRSHATYAADIVLAPGEDAEARLASIFERSRSQGVTLSAVDRLPLSGARGAYVSLRNGNESIMGLLSLTGGGYFRDLGIPLIAGRAFERRDTADSERVAIINEAVANRLGGARASVGRQVTLEGETGSRTIVGVVGNVKFGGITDRMENQYYLPYGQPFADRDAPSAITVLAGSAAGMSFTAFERAIHALEPEIRVVDVRTVDEVVTRAAGPQRMRMWLATVVNAFAWLMAGLGIYSLFSYSVEARRREIGIRMALGATRGQIASTVLRDALLFAVSGSTIGLCIVLSAYRWLRSMTADLSGLDAGTVAIALVLMVAGAVFATLLPAYKATRVDQMECIRAN